MAQVIMEDDIFKHLIPHHDEEVEMDVLNNVKAFLSDVPVNIFKNEYYILYQAIEMGSKYKMEITLDHLEQIVLTNLDEILKDPKITMYKDGEESYTENERANLIQQNVSSTFQMLEEDGVEENSLKALQFNTSLYIEEWTKEEYSRSLKAQDNILRDGRTYNGKLFKGVEDAHAYSQKKFDLIRSLREGDVDRLGDVIDTSVDTTEDISKKLQVDPFEVVASTGVEEFDKHYPLSRNEMIVIQGTSGVGKTRQAVNICHESAVSFKKNVLILSLEQKSARIFPMFISKHSTRIAESQADWIEDKDIVQDNLNEHEKMIKEIVMDDLVTNDEYGKIRVEGVNLHARDVRGHLEKVWDDGFHFDVVMLDYIGILDTVGEDRYGILTDVVNQLKAEVKTFKGQGFLAILPNQLNAEAEKEMIKGNYELSGTGGSETAYLRRGADYVYTIEQTEEMKATNTMKWIITKVRLGDPAVSKLDIQAFQGNCLYLSDNLDEVDEEDDLL